jgi:hypothetical protein
MLRPLIIHKCKKKVFKKIGTFTLHSIITHTGTICKMWVTHANSGWLNGEMMKQWLQRAYKQSLQEVRYDWEKTILFMGNCSAHDGDDTVEVMQAEGLQFE